MLERLAQSKQRFDRFRVNISEQRLSQSEQGSEGTFSGISPVLTVDQFGISPLDRDIFDSMKRFGTDNPEEYNHWARRACGVASVLTLLQAYGEPETTPYALIQELLSKNGYLTKDKYGGTDIGWKHQSLCDVITERGFHAELLKNTGVNGVTNLLNQEKQIIASVKSRTGVGNHLVVISGVTWRSNDPVFSVHDPYNLDGKGGGTFVSRSEFNTQFNNRGIIAWK